MAVSKKYYIDIRNDVNSKGIVKETILKPALQFQFLKCLQRKVKNLRDLSVQVLFTMKSPGFSWVEVLTSVPKNDYSR